MTAWTGWLAEQRTTRETAGLQRTLRPRQAAEDTIDLASNDYLGLSKHPDVCRAASDAVLTWGTGAGASRLVTGTTTLHADLERALSEFTGHEAALVCSTGYHANLAAVTALVDRHSLIVSDEHVHASLIDAARLSKAAVTVVPHNDVTAVRDALAEAGGRRTVVLTESVFSVLGDASPLADLADVCAAAGALLLVDEAHGLGVIGEDGGGAVRTAGLAGHPNVIMTATLSKSLGAMGGAVLGSAELVDHLVNRARPFIFDTGLAPAPTAAALAALRLLRDRRLSPAGIHRRGGELAERLGVPRSAGAVLSVPMPSPGAALAAQADALAAGVRVGCFRPPSVPDGVSRLRITTHTGLDDESWAHALDVLTAAVRRCRT
ncbi:MULTISPECIES: 8-amino-7-oxononanoate synthase [Prauserella salsuginis group]|uniref:8-amino-7-oxononanoate synthase n=1 Tax=Prauserella salsuginis TaxID=387889 RepID=A0ABW6GAM6_9PSEU|nr:MULTISPECIES: 8-amino-7-oxononanoate synthase [Prauserella salsuginis group]MCR3722904.1 8-amino-7-oxononanoate synthase (EC 2.3.1.47) [Prauserella flava]MCR3737421.1 8-amino-7-oxononanoate synthase (EC 2.3.1.47) [Prauserella salsuginis]